MSGDRMQIGSILDGLGVEADLVDSDLIASAVVILTVLTEDDGRPTLTIATSAGLSWIEQAGLVSLARDICVTSVAGQLRDDGDDY